MIHQYSKIIEMCGLSGLQMLEGRLPDSHNLNWYMSPRPLRVSRLSLILRKQERESLVRFFCEQREKGQCVWIHKV